VVGTYDGDWQRLYVDGTRSDIQAAGRAGENAWPRTSIDT